MSAHQTGYHCCVGDGAEVVVLMGAHGLAGTAIVIGHPQLSV